VPSGHGFCPLGFRVRKDARAIEEMANERLHAVMAGFLVPQATLQRILSVDRYMPMQTQKFSLSLVSGLRQDGWRVDLISSEPVGLYPSNPRKRVRGFTWQDDQDAWCATTTFTNRMIARHITRFISCGRLLLRWATKSAGPSSRGKVARRMIIVYGGHSPHLLAAVLTASLCRLPVVLIVTDPVSLPLPGDGRLKLLLRRFDR